MLLIGSEASARNEQLQWTHANPSTVQGFRVYWRLDGSSSQTQVSAGLPTIQNGRYVYTVANVPDTGGVWFSVRAYNAGGDSPSSNEICRGCGSTTPPPPPPPPPGGTPQAAISSFKLWNASTDQIAVDNFPDNGEITLSCAAIEIIGNTYLSNGGGSILKQLDNGQTVCENSPPYGWQDGATPGQFDCAALPGGLHTLMVTPFDGENCTGTMGISVDRTFTVNAPTAPPPPQQVGQPGKPYLVQ